jgi:hypothetical protein
MTPLVEKTTEQLYPPSTDADIEVAITSRPCSVTTPDCRSKVAYADIAKPDQIDKYLRVPGPALTEAVL